MQFTHRFYILYFLSYGAMHYQLMRTDYLNFSPL